MRDHLQYNLQQSGRRDVCSSSLNNNAGGLVTKMFIISKGLIGYLIKYRTNILNILESRIGFEILLLTYKALRSQSVGLLVVSRASKRRLVSRAFSYTRADTLSTFKNRLRTFLFDRTYRTGSGDFKPSLSYAAVDGSVSKVELQVLPTCPSVLSNAY